MEKMFAVRQFNGREFQTDRAAWLEALFGISVLTGGWVRKCLSDERNILVGKWQIKLKLIWGKKVTVIMNKNLFLLDYFCK